VLPRMSACDPKRPLRDQHYFYVRGLASGMKHPAKLSQEFSGALRTFSFWVANGSVGLPLLEGIDYWDALTESPSLMEEVYAIFVNVMEFNEDGVPINAKYAEFRAAQCIRRWCDPSYKVTPPFEAWETELHGPPSKLDIKPWPAGVERK